jgi:hypothetical protein
MLAQLRIGKRPSHKTFLYKGQPEQRELDQWLNRAFTIAVVGVNCQKPLSGDGITIVNYDRLARFENELGTYDLAASDIVFGKLPISSGISLILAGARLTPIGSRWSLSNSPPCPLR